MASSPSSGAAAVAQLVTAQLAATPLAGSPAGPAATDVPLADVLPPLLGEPLAEAALLGCVLRAGPQVAADLLRQVTAEDWAVPVHAHVAAAACALLEQAQPVDPVTVLGQLRRQGLEDARTANRDTGVLLVELCHAAPSVSSAGHYLRIVLEHSYRRRVQRAATRLAQAAEAGSMTELTAVVAREHAALTRSARRMGATRTA